ncbi:ER membrane protein complex subunit 1 isoform X2 [Danaus plexippus]|uniref:ER membrane protein complex subunit 1 isoform X2 n=1 Tax=Danaus plexippus TaxID=13037 RepID=UPI002AAFDA7F|nr:ER membrane protein complex subunit 1 isoform X2 [Danaus plexippus]
MGVLSSNFKHNFLGLLKFLNSMKWFIIFFSLINLSVCIYEDQIGKFDWRQTYVGRIKFAQFDTVSTAKKIIVATEENVLAALHLKTGEVVWRHVFENASPGNIHLLHVGEKITTVTGDNPYLVRGWDSATGVLMWEWTLMLQDDSRADFSEWWVQNGMLVHMLPVFNSHLEVTMYNVMSGSNRGATSKLPAIWNNEGCVLTAPYYTCVSGEFGSQILVSMDVTANAIQMISKPLSNIIEGAVGNLRALDGNSVIPGFIVDDKKIVLIKENDFNVLNVKVEDTLASASIADGARGPLVLQIWTNYAKGYQLIAHTLSGQLIPEIHSPDSFLDIPEPELLAVTCARDQLACRLLINGADDAVHLVQQGGVTLWSREESLANIKSVEFVDLPVSDADAALESEFDQKEGSVWWSFVRRLQSQYQQLSAAVERLRSGEVLDRGSASLHRDYFNLHRIMVLVTEAGKIFGMDNLSGSLVWRLYLPTLSGARTILLRRAARHPHTAMITIVGTHTDTGNGYIVTLDPITGRMVPEHTVTLDVGIMQCMTLQETGDDQLRALIVLDEDEAVQVYPPSAASLVHNVHMYVADQDTGRVRGYAIRYNGREAVAERTWSMSLGGSGPARIVAMSSRSRLERVRSPGRALADRSVLYKYSNPNMLLFVVEKPDPTHKEVVTAVVVDAVSGAVVGASSHRRARALPLAVHADNCFAYLYRSDKHRRVEIATMELYEGKDRWSPAGEPFSSSASWRTPVVERQAYILPALPSAAAFTITERSLTDRHVLLGLSSGGVVEVPWSLVEARRGAAGEESVLPYLPELPLTADRVLSYNLTLHRLAALHTAPAGLESTSLMLATGLDLFYTRVAPSRTFDLLKDDFDYYLITIVLAALVLATYGTKYLASRKTLKMAWK